MLHTTFKKARENRACSSGYDVVLEALGGEEYGDDRAIPLKKVVQEIGLKATLPVLPGCIIEQDKAQKFMMLFASDCIERVLPTFEEACPEDDRPRKVIDGIRSYLEDGISGENLLTLSNEAWEAGKNPELDSSVRFVARAVSNSVFPCRISMTINCVLRSLPKDERDTEVEWQTEHFLSLLDEIS